MNKHYKNYFLFIILSILIPAPLFSTVALRTPQALAELKQRHAAQLAEHNRYLQQLDQDRRQIEQHDTNLINTGQAQEQQLAQNLQRISDDLKVLMNLSLESLKNTNANFQAFLDAYFNKLKVLEQQVLAAELSETCSHDLIEKFKQKIAVLHEQGNRLSEEYKAFLNGPLFASTEPLNGLNQLRNRQEALTTEHLELEQQIKTGTATPAASSTNSPTTSLPAGLNRTPSTTASENSDDELEMDNSTEFVDVNHLAHTNSNSSSNSSQILDLDSDTDDADLETDSSAKDPFADVSQTSSDTSRSSKKTPAQPSLTLKQLKHNSNNLFCNTLISKEQKQLLTKFFTQDKITKWLDEPWEEFNNTMAKNVKFSDGTIVTIYLAQNRKLDANAQWKYTSDPEGGMIVIRGTTGANGDKANSFTLKFPTQEAAQPYLDLLKPVASAPPATGSVQPVPTPKGKGKGKSIRYFVPAAVAHHKQTHGNWLKVDNPDRPGVHAVANKLMQARATAPTREQSRRSTPIRSSNFFFNEDTTLPSWASRLPEETPRATGYSILTAQNPTQAERKAQAEARRQEALRNEQQRRERTAQYQEAVAKQRINEALAQEKMNLLLALNNLAKTEKNITQAIIEKRVAHYLRLRASGAAKEVAFSTVTNKNYDDNASTL